VTARFRLITANLANGGAEAEAFACRVAELEPDVVAVQELVPEQAAALARVMPFGTLQPRRDFMGMGVALRRPAPVRVVELPRRSAWVVDLTVTGGQPVEVINAHILAPHIMPTWRTLAIRRGQTRALLAYLDSAPARPRVLVGDLNSTPTWPIYRHLAGRLTDAVVEAARANGGRPHRTWAPWPGGPRLFRIDHCFTSGLRVIGAQVIDLTGSDHAALVVDLVAPKVE
jgi:endonuclease/exonuclease/phosphatase family metal-dependent hydrolase